MDHLAMKTAMVDALSQKVSILEQNNKEYFIQIEDSKTLMNALAAALQYWLNAHQNDMPISQSDIDYSIGVLQIYNRYINDLSTIDKVADLHNQIVDLVSGYND